MIWQQWWGDLGAVVAILGAIWALGRKIGKQEQQMKQIKNKVDIHETTLTAHTAQLASGSGDFKVIDEKLETIKESQKEMRDLLIKHITKEHE